MKDRWREVLYRVAAELAWFFWQSYSEFPADHLRQYLKAATQGLA